MVEIRGFVGRVLDASVIAQASARRGSHGTAVTQFSIVTSPYMKKVIIHFV